MCSFKWPNLKQGVASFQGVLDKFNLQSDLKTPILASVSIQK